MNIVDGLASFVARKKLKNNEIAKMLGCSDGAVSQYMSGKCGISIERLAILLKNGMTLEEAFGDDVAKAIKENLVDNSANKKDSLYVVVDGLQRILDLIKTTY